MKQDVMDPALAGQPELPDPKAPIPRQIRYIIGNEGCERFSFYGMRNILTMFLVSSLLLYLREGDREHAAKNVFHSFCHWRLLFFPVLGAWLAEAWSDRARLRRDQIARACRGATVVAKRKRNFLPTRLPFS